MKNISVSLKKFFNTLAMCLLPIALLTMFAACASDEKGEVAESKSANIIGLNYDNTAMFSYVRPRYLTDEETRTIGEIFTGEEYTHGQLIIRTQPDKRAGMYFFVMFDYAPDEIALASTFELTVDSSDFAHPRTYKFVVPQTHSVLREIKLGITGSDWKTPKGKVNAWKLVLKSPAGKVLAEKQSWLWSLRDAENKKLSNEELIKKNAEKKSAETQNALKANAENQSKKQASDKNSK